MRIKTLVLVMSVSQFIASADALIISTNPNKTNNANDPGWNLVSTPGYLDGAGSGFLGSAVTISDSPTLGMATSGVAGWISAGTDFGSFLHSRPNAANEEGQRNSPGIYSFLRQFTITTPSIFHYSVAGNDIVFLTLYLDNSSISTFRWDSSSTMSPLQGMFLLPGTYSISVDLTNLPSGPLSNPIRYQSSPAGFLLDGNVSDVPEPSSAVMIGIGLSWFAAWRCRTSIARTRVKGVFALVAALVTTYPAVASSFDLLPNHVSTLSWDTTGGFGYQISNASGYWMKPTAVGFDPFRNADVQFIGLFETVAPGQTLIVPYTRIGSPECAFPPCGLLEATWSLYSAIGDYTFGVVRYEFDLYALEPSDSSAMPISSVILTSPYSFSNAPEPSSYLFLATGGVLIWLSRRRRRQSLESPVNSKAKVP